MSFVDTLMGFFSAPAEQTKDEAPDGACGNCRGRYEYDGKIRGAARDRGIDIRAGRERYAFIQQFVSENLEPIQLQSSDGDDELRCPHCAKLYPVSGS